MVLKAKVTVTGTKEFRQMLRQIERLDLTDIGEIVRQRMIDVIDENRKTDLKQPEQRYGIKYGNCDKHISDALSVTSIPGKGIGIGDIEQMNAEVPYWRLVNDGGRIKGTPRGAFLGGPGSAFQFSADGPRMVPTQDIAPMNYIQKTFDWVNKNLKRLLDKKLTREFKDGRQKSFVRIG